LSACALEDGVVSCWGTNSMGELGDGTTVERMEPRPVVGLPSNVRVVEVAFGHACAIVDADLWCWGTYAGFERAAKKRKLFAGGVGALAMGQASCAAARDSSEVMCWGTPLRFRESSGSIYDPSHGLSNTPKRLRGFDDAGVGGTVTAMFGGSGGSWAPISVIIDGRLQFWSPLRSRADGPPTLTDVTAAAASDRDRCAISKGQLWCWEQDGAAPRRVELPATATMIALGDRHQCALAGGDVYCWGPRDYPALGDGRPLCIPEYCWNSHIKYDGGRKCDEKEEPCREDVPRRVAWD